MISSSGGWAVVQPVGSVGGFVGSGIGSGVGVEFDELSKVPEMSFLDLPDFEFYHRSFEIKSS